MNVLSSIPHKVLKAASMCVVPKHDVRINLHGVYIQVEQECIFIASTDGVMLFAGRIERHNEEIMELIIPTQAVAAAIKAHKGNADYWLTKQSDNEYSLDDIGFVPVNARFPSFKRAIPQTVNGDAGMYDYQRLNTLIKALEIACGCYPVFHQNGMARAAVVTGPAQAGQQYAGIIMPLRSKLYPYKGFKID